MARLLYIQNLTHPIWRYVSLTPAFSLCVAALAEGLSVCYLCLVNVQAV